MEINNEDYEPLYEKIKNYNIQDLIALFCSKEDLIVLSSALLMPEHGRYSYLCFDSFASFIAKDHQFLWNNTVLDIDKPFDFIQQKLNEYKIKKHQDLPPLQGGVVGYFGYEASHYLEELPKLIDNIGLPDIYLNFYHSIIAIDHVLSESWIISTGFPEKNNIARQQMAKQQIKNIKQIITNGLQTYPPLVSPKIPLHTITSNFSESSYKQAVEETKNAILEGDIFEANITQQFKAMVGYNFDALALYYKLIQLNPSPYSAFIKIPNYGYIISASPEKFIKMNNQLVETYPIKGTIKCSKNTQKDLILMESLLNSEKDRAENIMIVDLMRNDLSKVCLPGSVKVEELCSLKSFATLHHLVSKISAQLKVNKDGIDLMKASFPPGSVTGAPKIRSMEIISEVEKEARGPYCGSIGYISFTGDMDTSVTIRSYYLKDKNIFFSAGGAVVLDSDPQEEYMESLAKAKALMEALTT